MFVLLYRNYQIAKIFIDSMFSRLGISGLQMAINFNTSTTVSFQCQIHSRGVISNFILHSF